MGRSTLAARLITYVSAVEYGDGPPLYRQAQTYDQGDVNINRSTTADWVGHSALPTLASSPEGLCRDMLRAGLSRQALS
ncbi:IS66 family transposase [Parvularcula dongshanensis]|uniref:IS66 family transposase n=1 Tax=Parvularcula dongshanensis TaxID=1173995 RepID=UPI003CCD189A